jgi:hypothetical protein
MSNAVRIVRWDQLPIDQQRVLTSAMERDTLSLVYLRWRPARDGSFNRGLNNRGRPYAEALIPAAVGLIRAGLVGVSITDPVLRYLPEGEAIEVVQDINNWWRYESIPGLADPLDPGPGPGGRPANGSWRSEYALDEVNQDRFRLSSWEQPPPMDQIVQCGALGD